MNDLVLRAWPAGLGAKVRPNESLPQAAVLQTPLTAGSPDEVWEIVATLLNMISILNVVLCAVLAVLFWTCIGFAIGQRIFPQALALPLAPTLGWAVQNALALPIFFLLRFSQTNVVVVAVLAIGISLIAIKRDGAREPTTTLPWWAYAIAADAGVRPDGCHSSQKHDSATASRWPDRCSITPSSP